MIIKNLILPVVIVLVLYAIPVVPTWFALKKRKAPFGAFLGWIWGEMVLINVILFLLSFVNFYSPEHHFFELSVFAIFISAFFLLFSPFIVRALLFKKESIKKANLYATIAFLIVVLQSIFPIAVLIYGFSQFEL